MKDSLQPTNRIVTALGMCAMVWLSLVPNENMAAEIEEQVIGDPDAPVTIIEYSSMSCPHCARFHNETLPDLKSRYIDTGKVRLVLRDFPLEESALEAAVIAHCAGPDRYVSFVDVFFKTYESWSQAEDPLVELKRVAKLGGLGNDQIDACLGDESMVDGILQSRLDGQNEHGVQSTPTFIIDGQVYPGARDVDAFSAIVDPLLDGS